MGINCLSDGILLKIFSFLTPQALCQGAQVNISFNSFSSTSMQQYLLCVLGCFS